jgi:hypothetical protein
MKSERTPAKIIQHLCFLILILAVVSITAGCDNFNFFGLIDQAKDDDEGLELQISPIYAQVAVGSDMIFTAKGGIRPYTFSIVSGNGTIEQDTGVYTAPVSASSDIVRVTDSNGAFVDAQVVVIE